MADSNKVALITGSAKGIGKAIALRLAKDNYNIAVNYNGSKELAKETANECIALGVDSIVVKADVSDNQEVKSMIDEIMDKYGRIDCLVNNSGITKDNLILRMKEEDFDSVIAINLKGTYNTIKYVSPIMLKQRFGNIINISSVAGIIGNIGQVNYAASKSGVIGITKTIAKELAPRGIRCNAVAPGFIETDMTSVLSTDVLEKIMNSIPLQKAGKPSDVANAVSFLASDESSYITGQVIKVDGGMVI